MRERENGCWGTISRSATQRLWEELSQSPQCSVLLGLQATVPPKCPFNMFLLLPCPSQSQRIGPHLQRPLPFLIPPIPNSESFSFLNNTANSLQGIDFPNTKVWNDWSPGYPTQAWNLLFFQTSKQTSGFPSEGKESSGFQRMGEMSCYNFFQMGLQQQKQIV